MALKDVLTQAIRMQVLRLSYILKVGMKIMINFARWKKLAHKTAKMA